MINNQFNVKKLPKIQNIVEINATNDINRIKENYKILKADARKIVIYCLKDKLHVSTTYYNLLFYVEISLKYYLLIASELNIEQIEKYGHNIPVMINKIKEKNKGIEKLKFLLDKIKMKNGQRLDLSKYYNYKYNKEIGSTSLIFDFEMNNNNQKNIKEVIEWLNLHI